MITSMSHFQSASTRFSRQPVQPTFGGLFGMSDEERARRDEALDGVKEILDQNKGEDKRRSRAAKGVIKTIENAKKDK